MTSTTLHGVFMSILDLGVLLMGPSGIGKSELALGLITRGHHLIADDCTKFTRAQQKIIGCCPEVLQDFLEVRGLGILNIRTLFGDHAILPNKHLALIIHISHFTRPQLQRIDRLMGLHQIQDILGISVPKVTIPVTPGRNLAILIECAVRNHLLKQSGYDAGKEFIKRQEMQ